MTSNSIIIKYPEVREHQLLREKNEKVKREIKEKEELVKSRKGEQLQVNSFDSLTLRTERPTEKNIDEAATENEKHLAQAGIGTATNLGTQVQGISFGRGHIIYRLQKEPGDS